MYIKQIIIQGFKTYKDQTVIEPFSPGTNVIVGRNGSGKSNFFAAIMFVLSDKYNNLSRESRQAILHEGSGSAVMSAYVEIIFDNSDDRFPTGGKEVIIRRTISLKKDEYSLDRKVVQRGDVTNMLEAAGFSRANPYYIVPQGSIASLTNMKESARLNLLKEVAGTKLYEFRRQESLKIMEDTNNRREKIDEMLKYIKDRLSELEAEKDELRKFQEKDRERRCLEYAYHHQEQVKIQERLDEIDTSRQGRMEDGERDQAEFTEGEKAIAKLADDIRTLTKQMELVQIDRRQLEEDRRKHSKALANAELKVKGLAEGQSAEEQARTQHAASLERVKRDIAVKEQELTKIIPEFTKRKKKEIEVKQTLDTAEAARRRLLTKQTRSSQFRNKAERDAQLRSEIQQLNLDLGKQRSIRLDTDEDLKTIEASIKHLEQEVSGLREELESWGDRRSSLNDEKTHAQDAVEALIEEKTLLIREEEKLSATLKAASKEKEQAERDLRHAMDGQTSKGLETIRRLKQQQDIPGAYGTLAELIEVSEAYRIAVEQTAGNSLFHYVVDNVQTATHLANTLQNQYGGRVTFMPLSELRNRKIPMPRASDAVPLVSKIKYDARYEQAIQHVFGRTVVCSNLAVAGQYARSHGVDGITPEGDTTNKRGAMTGGYIDPGRSRLVAVKALEEARDEYERLLEEQTDMSQKIESKSQEITRAVSNQRKAEQQLLQFDSGLAPLNRNLQDMSGHLQRERNRKEATEKSREEVHKTMNDFGETIAALEAEMKTDFKKALSSAEERQVEDLGTKIQELLKQWNDVSRQRRDLEQRKQILEMELEQNLRPKLDQLNSQAFENRASSSVSGGLKEAQRELKKAQKASSASNTRFQETEDNLDELKSRIDALEAKKTEREQEQQRLGAKILDHQKKMEKGLQRKTALNQRAAEVAKSIRDLGVLPEEAFGKYERMDQKTIEARMKKVNAALKTHGHVNKKAFEQYSSFTAQQEQLLKRRQDLDTSQASIEGLVQHLDQKKDEAIERTFKQVSKEFATIFEKLVPAGQGRLVIQRRTDRRGEPEDSDDEEQMRSVENYTGVGISVSFNSKLFDEQQKIQQLSGGQKSLCALCLIFALQQTESSPMVIFDEVDANLDAQYRTAVAALLQSISREAGTQFISTTFRPEMVLTADKCYGVTFRNKTSSIDCVSNEDALEFVEGQQKT